MFGQVRHISPAIFSCGIWQFCPLQKLESLTKTAQDTKRVELNYVIRPTGSIGFIKLMQTDTLIICKSSTTLYRNKYELVGGLSVREI